MKIKNFNDIKSLFLDNVTIKQTLFKNTFWLAVAEGISKFLKLILFIYVARILGATEYGKFSFALAFIGLFAVFSSLGLPRIVVRELAQGKEKEEDFSAILSLRILLGLGALILISLGAFLITKDPLIQKIILILALYTLLDNFSGFLNFFFQARQKMEYEAWTKIIRTLLLMIFGFFIIFNFPSVKNLSFGYLFSALISLIFILIFFHFKVFSLRISFDRIIWKKYLAMSWPVALAGIFSTIYSQVDSVIMGFFQQITETGFYNAAYRVVGAVFIPVGLISTSFYPVLSRTFKESKEKFDKAWNFQMKILILLAFPVIVGGTIFASKIINFIYGPDFSSSIPVFQILILMAGLSFFYTPFSHAMFVFNQQSKLFWITLFGATFNLILNLILIPKFSLYGAAFAALITSFFLLSLFAGFAWRFTSVRIFNSKLLLAGTSAAISTLIMYLVISNPNIYNLHVVFSIIIGAITYFSVFFTLNYLIKYFGLFQNEKS